MNNEELYYKRGLSRRDLESILRNASGCVDPTAYEAFMNMSKEELDRARMRKVLHCIFDICALSGFKVEGRIVLRDVETGKVYK